MSDARLRQQVQDLRHSAQLARKERDDARKECAQWVERIVELENRVAFLTDERAVAEVERGRIAEELLRHRHCDPEPTSWPLADPMRRLAENRPTLADMLHLSAHAWPDSLDILPTAYRAAELASDFDRPLAALQLLSRLATDYRDALLSGDGDRAGIAIFGDKFAATESETVRRNENALRLRTFENGGRRWEMLRHLKIGTKPSDAKTLRIHFDWDAPSGRVVVGHCGRHLDFR
jgi:hypothetical protein